MQFDLTADSDKDVTVNWADGDSGNVQKAVQTDSNGKTQITFYVSKLRPLSNSSNVQVATIVTDRELNSSSFCNQRLHEDSESESKIDRLSGCCA